MFRSIMLAQRTIFGSACKSLISKKTFAPPFGTSDKTEPVEIKGGFKFDEDDKSYTLWMVSGSGESVDLRNESVFYRYPHTY